MVVEVVPARVVEVDDEVVDEEVVVELSAVVEVVGRSVVEVVDVSSDVVVESSIVVEVEVLLSTVAFVSSSSSKVPSSVAWALGPTTMMRDATTREATATPDRGRLTESGT